VVVAVRARGSATAESAGAGERAPHGSRALPTVWALFGLVAVAILVTYWRLPASVLYHVSGSGPAGGAGRVLVFSNFPVALAAIAVLLVLLDRLRTRRRRALAVAALGMCAVGPMFVDVSDLDARPVNAIAAAGVAIALALTVAAPSPSRPVQRSRSRRGDRVRLALALALLVVAVPAAAADLGFYLDRVPLLGGLYETGALRREPGVEGLHVAVHHGHHEGMDGVLLAWSALLLWPCLWTISRRRLRALLGAYLPLLLSYGAAVALADFWLEQVVKRG
jgi:hypothetical protein